MKKISWQQILATVPLIGAIATLIAAILGEGGISGLLSKEPKLPSDPEPSIIINNNVGSNSARELETDNTQPEPVNSQALIRFSCQKDESNLSTVASNVDYPQPVRIIDWNIENQYFGDEWTPERRCDVVSERFQSIFDRNRLVYMTVDAADWEGSLGEPVICAVLEENDRCVESDLLFTLENTDEPNEILTEITAIRTDPTNNKALVRGGGDSFYEGFRIYYNIAEHLKITDTKAPKPLF